MLKNTADFIPIISLSQKAPGCKTRPGAFPLSGSRTASRAAHSESSLPNPNNFRSRPLRYLGLFQTTTFMMYPPSSKISAGRFPQRSGRWQAPISQTNTAESHRLESQRPASARLNRWDSDKSTRHITLLLPHYKQLPGNRLQVFCPPRKKPGKLPGLPKALLFHGFNNRIGQRVEVARLVAVQRRSHSQAVAEHGHILQLILDEFLHQVA